MGDVVSIMQTAFTSLIPNLGWVSQEAGVNVFISAQCEIGPMPPGQHARHKATADPQ